MHYKGTQGGDDYTGTSGGDRFNMAQGGDDTVSGGAGNDIFGYGATLTAADRIDGGDGTTSSACRVITAAPMRSSSPRTRWSMSKSSSCAARSTTS